MNSGTTEQSSFWDDAIEIITGVRNFLFGPPCLPVQVFPRKKDFLFDAAKNVRKVLPDAFPAMENQQYENLKEIEFSIFPDLSTNKTITIYLCRKDNGKIVPDSGKKVYIRINKEVSSPSATISCENAVSDDKGLAEVVVSHPAETPPDSKQKVELQFSLYAEFDDCVSISLPVCRNQQVDDTLENVKEGRTFLVRQNANFEASDGVKKVQELLNQVVSRHKGITDYTWLELDGMYGNGCEEAVSSFLTAFSGSFDYAKGHFNVKQTDELKAYCRNEFGSYTAGKLIDVHVLIGETEWIDDDPIMNIDGLLDIYYGVVRRFFEQMEARAQAYTSCNTFWLHRTSHLPYREGSAVCVKAVATAPANTSPSATSLQASVSGTNLTVQANTEYTVLEERLQGTALWYRLQIQPQPGATGWIPATNCATQYCNDRANACNAGTFGGPGVAYGFGNKDLPEEFSQSIRQNTPEPQAILSWKQYTNGHKPGKMKSDSDTVNWTGCDCSGFVQNCATHCLLSDNETRIIPETMMRRIGRVGKDRWPTNCIGASGFVGAYARRFKYHTDKTNKQWLDKTDIIATDKHIVWVAEEAPDAIDDHCDFQVYNAYGEYSRCGDLPKVPTDQFIRKVISMPFKWWGKKCGEKKVKLARLYFWE